MNKRLLNNNEQDRTMRYNTTKSTRINLVSNGYFKTFGKVPKANTIVLRKGTEINNVLKKIRIKKELEATSNSPNSTPQSEDLGYYSNDILVIK